MATLAYPLPRQYPITRGFADTSITRVGSFGGLGAHTGLDLGAGCGVPVLAAGRGLVARVISGAAALVNTGGRQVRVTHSDSLTSEYLHLSAAYVREGQLVDAGAVIGSVGASGAATGCHLHFQVNLNGSPVDPGPYLGLGSTVPGGSPVSDATLAGLDLIGKQVCASTPWQTATGAERGRLLTKAKDAKGDDYFPNLDCSCNGAGWVARPTGQQGLPLCFPAEQGPGIPGVVEQLPAWLAAAAIEAILNLAILGTSVVLIVAGIRQAARGD